MKAKPKSTAKTGRAKTKSAGLDKLEQKRALEVLRESEEKFSAAFDSAPTALMIASLPENKFEYVNESFLHLHGYQRDEVIGRTLDELNLFPNPDEPAKIKELLIKTKFVRNMEVTVRTKNGEIRHVLFSIDIIRLNQQPHGLTTMVDITERVLIEKQAVKMKRLYAALSQVNQMITRVKSQQELFESICRVAVDFGEFPLAWVGLLDEATGDVKPVAAKGLDVNHWTLPIVNIHTGPLSDGLIARALRTSSVVSTDNMQSDEGLQVLRDLFHEHGFHASAVMPFRLRGRVIGALTLISPEIGAFRDVEEIRLLDEMGLDISFALDTLETEAEHKQAEEKIRLQNLRLNVLREIDTAILSADSMESIVHAALDHVHELLRCRRASLSLFDWGTNEAVIFDVRTTGETSVPTGTRMPLGLFQDMIQTLSMEQPVVMQDLSALADPPLQIQRQIGDGLRSMCLLPLFSQNTLIGSFSLFSEFRSFFDVEKIELGREVANQVAIAITQKRLAATLHESEQKFSTLFEKAAFAIALSTLSDGVIVNVNESFEEIFGFTRQEAIGKTSLELGLNPDAEGRARTLAELKEHGFARNLELLLRVKSGELRLFSVNLDFVNIGDQKFILNLTQDITERKRAEAALGESEEKYHLLADNMLDFVSTSDLSGGITYVSPSIERALGYSFTELQSLPRELYMTPESIQEIDRVMLEEITKELESGADPNRYRVLEVEYIRKDGSHLICELKSSAVRDRAGFPVGVQTIGRDLTNRKQAEAALRISEQNAHRMAESLRMVNEISTKITSGLDLERLLQALYEECKRIGDTDQFYVSLYDDVTEMLSFPVNYENGEQSPIASRPNHTVPGFTEYILEHRQTLHVRDTFVLPSEGALNRKSDDPTRSYIGVPLMIKDRVVGVLSMQSHAPNAYTPEQIHTLELLATQAAIAIHNAQLFEQAQQEISERKQAEDKLRAQTERLDLATHSAGIGTWDWDIQKNKLIWDDRMYGLYGIKPGDFGGAYEAWLNGLHADDRSSSEEIISQTLRGEREYDTEFRVLWPDGRIHWLKANGQAFWDRDHQPLRMVGVNYDITERKQAEEQIQRQLRHLQALRRIDIAISSSFDLEVVLDVVLQQAHSELNVDASAILLVNHQLHTIEYAASRGFHSNALHYTKLRLGEGYAGRAVTEREIVHISDFMESGGKLASAIQLESEVFMDYYGVPLIVKGEVKGVLEIYQRTPLNADDEWMSFLETLAGQAAIAIDNTQLFENLERSNAVLEHRVAERTLELNRANIELEHANRAKDEFLATMSHELRTPLNSILGMSESLLEQRRGPLNEHQQKWLQIIGSSGQHLLELINDILDLSKVEAGKIDLYPEPVSVDELCKSSLAFIKAQAVKKSILIDYINHSSISQIFADSRRLKQILVNLLTNAVKFTPDHGQVTLQVDGDAEQGRIQFSIIDTGVGIALKDLRQLFIPFSQVDSSLTRQHEGTGLGLALVQKLTDLHGGSVDVESEVGKGSRFTINLPIGKVMPAQPGIIESTDRHPISEQAEKLNASEVVKRQIILLAEDNMANILTIGDYLESYDYQVVIAKDGLSAIELAEALQPAIILMDIQMPVLDGMEAIRRLRALPRFATTPIIALTALAMPGDRERCLRAGASEYMSKPVSLKTLVKLIDKLLQSAT